MTVRELLQRIDSRELSEWMAYANLEPFGPVQEDLRAGYIVAQVANSWGGSSRSPGDYFPSLELATPPETPEQAAARARASCLSMRGTIIEVSSNPAAVADVSPTQQSPDRPWEQSQAWPSV